MNNNCSLCQNQTEIKCERCEFEMPSITLNTNLSRKDFVFLIGYDGPKVVIDTYSQKKFGALSTLELANKGLFRAAISSALYSQNPLELNEVADMYNRIGGTEYKPEDLPRLFGVPRNTWTLNV